MRKALFLFVFALLLAACTSPTAIPTLVPTASRSIPSPTVTLSATVTLTPSITPTPTASQTPILPTIKPLPTIATFTPTFDVRTVVTVTPAPKAECPSENPDAVTDFDPKYSYSTDELAAYLNAGMSRKSIASNLGNSLDITGDGIEELFIRGSGNYMIHCEDGKYKTLLQKNGEAFHTDPNVFSTDLKDVVDLNKDGIPELIFLSFYSHGDASIYIYEWDGSEMRSLISDHDTDTVGLTSMYKIEDTNGDGLKEIVIVRDYRELEAQVTVGRNMSFFADPYRGDTITLAWNGQNFVNITPDHYVTPKYRFQVIQDADRAATHGDYQHALTLYQQAIFDNKLEWWSAERGEYESSTYSSIHSAQPTPIANLTEYPQLAAYAYYRMIILHIHLGEMDAAQTQYTTLQAKFPAGSSGHPYAEMASQFWDAYQSTGKMYNACAVAIAFADAHPEILTPLGSGYLDSSYHGEQSHPYIPADVCPFR